MDIGESRPCCGVKIWEVNRKRVQRLWRREGLKVPQSLLLGRIHGGPLTNGFTDMTSQHAISEHSLPFAGDGRPSGYCVLAAQKSY